MCAIDRADTPRFFLRDESVEAIGLPSRREC